MEWLDSFTLNGCQTISGLKEVLSFRLEILKSLASSDSSISNLNGNYLKYDDKDIANSASIMIIALNDNRVFLNGIAFWIGNPTLGQVHIGEFEGIAPVKDNKISFSDDYCTVEMQFQSSVLVVTKETGCEGKNISFKGKYRKNISY